MFIDGISFKIKGINFENEDNVDIQKGIYKILKEYKKEYIQSDELYDGNSNSDIKDCELTVSEFEGICFGGKIKRDIVEGKEVYKIYISKNYYVNEFHFYNIDDMQEIDDDNYFHIGYMYQKDKNELKKILSTKDVKEYRISLQLIGGKCKYYDSYNEVIKTTEREYKAEAIIFLDDGIKENKFNDKIEQPQNDDKTYNDIENDNATEFDYKTIKMLIILLAPIFILGIIILIV